MRPMIPIRMLPGLCGPAALKVVLTHYKKDYTHDEIAKLCEVTPDEHASHAKMISGATAAGLRTTPIENATINDIRRFVDDDFPVIVGWLLDGKDHYSVVYDVGKMKIFMMDPATESGIRILPIEKFEEVWSDHGGDAGATVTRWMMSVKKG
ncbi:C39 family peptidase [Candidatus Uhrbacteria bacterium]|nr:C39 family peptidase [Candidatus Uhrbacteria bacterium]